MAARHRLRLIDVEKLGTHGGSIRVYLAHQASARRPAPAIADLLEGERKLGFLDIATYGSFAGRVPRMKRQLLAFLIKAKDADRAICGYGAPAKTTRF
jgi:hypothetical protein